MQLWEQFSNLSPALRVAVTGIVVGGIINGVKRWPRVPSQWVPLASIAAAALVYLAYLWLLDLQLDGNDAALIAEMLASGTLPIGGHKLIKPVWVAVLGEESADKWLGQADGEAKGQKPDNDDESDPMSGFGGGLRASLLLVALAFPAITGMAACGPVLDAIANVRTAAPAIGHIIDSAEGVADLYFRRHPSIDRQNEVAKAMTAARLALVAMEEAAMAAEAADDAETEIELYRKLKEQRDHFLNAYAALRKLLALYGVLTASPPEGGAEGVGPPPEPFDMPTAADLSARL